MKTQSTENTSSPYRQTKWIFFFMAAVLAAVLIPLFWISHYNFMSVDDYTYAQNGEEAWRQTHSVLKVLIQQIANTKDTYNSWQGTFFSSFLSTTLIGFLAKNAYFAGTYLSLGGFVLAESFLLMTLFRKVLAADFYVSCTVTLSCLCIQILLTPVPCEAFFWFCSSMLYTVIHSLSLLLYTLWILFFLNNGKKRARDHVLFAGILLLSVAVAGSNYITALTAAILYVFCTAGFFLTKRRGKIRIAVCLGLYLVSFLFNALAPGNTARQTASGVERMGVLECILRSLKEAADYITVWTILPVILLGVMLVPLFIMAVSKKKYRFPLPGLVSIVSFGIFAAQFAPTLYALGIIGAGRVLNLYRFNLFILLYGNELYWIGWFYRKWADRIMPPPNDTQRRKKVPGLLLFWLGGCILLGYSLRIWAGSTLTSVNAFQSLRSGEARQYQEEYQERLTILNDPSIQNAKLAPFSVKPYLLFFNDIVENPNDWVNAAMARYFHKESVSLE